MSFVNTILVWAGRNKAVSFVAVFAAIYVGSWPLGDPPIPTVRERVREAEAEIKSRGQWYVICLISTC